MAAAWSPGWCVRVGWFPLVASAGGDARLHPVIAVRQFNGLHDLGGVRARIRRGITESSPRTRSCVPPSQPCPGHPRPDAACHHDAATKRARPSPSRLPWSELYRRVFREDLLVCPRAPAACGSWLRSPTPPPPTPLRPRRSPHRAAHGRPPRAPPQVPLWSGALDPPADLDALRPRVGGRTLSRFLRARARGQPPARRRRPTRVHAPFAPIASAPACRPSSWRPGRPARQRALRP
jgi:hypothetical protein